MLLCSFLLIRSIGAAQGLAEVCGLCSDAGRREAMIQRVLAIRVEKRAVAREGLLWFLSFLPATLKEKTATYLDTFMPIIMESFQDDAEAVREVSIRAGRVVISVLGLRSSIDISTLLLGGLYKDDYKIRLYSLQLLGELLVLIGDIKVGFSSFGETDEVEEEVEQLGATRILSRLRERLGKPLLDRILASIYLIRSDFAISVRQHALQIWKGIVSNTPKTLIEVMPVLVEIIVTYLSRVEEDLRLISGRCIGELVSKLGDRVLPAIINPLQEGLQGKSTEARLGICTGLTEILSACSRKQAEDYIQVIIRTVKSAVVDESVEVSAQGARGFLVLYRLVGAIAVDQILPVLLTDLRSSTDGDHQMRVLRGLREIVYLRPKEMLEYLIPLLLVTPMSAASTAALCTVLKVSGSYMPTHFHSIFPAVIAELIVAEKNQSSLLNDLKEVVVAIVTSLEQQGVHHFIVEIGKYLENENNSAQRRWGCYFVEQLFLHFQKAEIEEYYPVLLKLLLARITDPEIAVAMALREAMQSMVTSVPLDRLVPHGDFIKNCLASNISSARHKTSSLRDKVSGELIFPYFTIPKAADPFLTLFLFGLVNGSTQMKEISADIIGDICTLATVEVLKPTLLKTVGPLIRVLGERQPSNVKSAILSVSRVVPIVCAE